jgi:hypothetical protein
MSNQSPYSRELDITSDIIERLKDSDFAAEWLKAQDEGEEGLHVDLAAKDARIAALESALGKIANMEICTEVGDDYAERAEEFFNCITFAKQISEAALCQGTGEA